MDKAVTTKRIPECDSDCSSHLHGLGSCDCSALVAEARLVAAGNDQGCIISQLADALEQTLKVIHARQN